MHPLYSLRRQHPPLPILAHYLHRSSASTASRHEILLTRALSRLALLCLCSLTLCVSLRAADTLYSHSSQQWSDSAHIWSSTPTSTGLVPWIPSATASLNSPGGTLSLVQYNPLLRALTVADEYTLQSSSNEFLQFCTGDSGNNAFISVDAGHSFNLRAPVVSAATLFKKGSGNITLGSDAFRLLGCLHVSAGNASLADVTPSPALRALRVTLLELDSGSSFSFSSSSNAADMHCANLRGSGTISVGGAAANGLIMNVMDSSSFAGTLSGGTNGAVVDVMGEGRQVLSGQCSGVNGTWVVCGRNATDSVANSALVVSGTATLAHALQLRGGRLVLDNRATNLTTRLGSSSSTTLNCNGGELCLRGNSSGTNQHIGVAGTKAMTLNAGYTCLRVEQDSDATTGSQLLIGGANSNFSLRDNTAMVINFESNRGSLGGNAATDPRIAFLGSGQPFQGLGSLLANTATSGTPGFALVNGNCFASWGSNGVKAAIFSVDSTISQLQASTNASVVDFRPSSTLTLNANISAAALRISTQGADSLICGTKNIISTALMLDADSAFCLSGSGSFGSGVNTRYIVVCRPHSTLRCTLPLGSPAAPITKAGRGTLELCGTSNQLAFSSANNVNVLQGNLCLSAASMGGAGSSANANCSINLRGGVLELYGGMNFVRAVDQSPTSAGGSVSFDAGVTNRGSGGFAAKAGTSTVTLVTSVGGSTPAVLQWNDNVFVPSYAALLLNADDADSRIELNNDLQLDNGTAGEYVAREVYVADNPTSDSDCARLNGVISGSSAADLVKSGPGTLELNASNTFGGNLIILDGVLRCRSENNLASGSSVLLKNATLRIDASQQIKDIVLEAGATLDLQQDTLSISGMFSNNGGRIVGNGILRFNGAAEQIVSGECRFVNLCIDNAKGVQCVQNCRVAGVLSMRQGLLYNNSSTLSLDTNATVELSSASHGWIVGPLAAYLDGTHHERFMAIGDSQRFAPMWINCENVTQAGMLRCTSQAGLSSHFASSGGDSSAAVQRHYDVAAEGLQCARWQCSVLLDSIEYTSQIPRSQLRTQLYDGSGWTTVHTTIVSDTLNVDSLSSFGELQSAVPQCSPKTIVAWAGENGHIIPADTVLLSCGATQSFSVFADSCATIEHVEVDGQNVGALSSFTFNDIQSSHEIRVWFQSNVVTPEILVSGYPEGDSICQGETLNLHAEIHHGGADPVIAWFVNAEQQSAVGPDFSLDTATDGDEIRCRLTSSEACAIPATVMSVAHTIHVTANPTAQIQHDSLSWCPNTTRSFFAPNAIGQLQWSVEGAAEIVGADNTEELILHSDDLRPDSVHISLNVTNSAGCSAQKDLWIAVGDTSAPVLNLPSDKTISCDEANDLCACGQATAVDNCSDVVLAHQDSLSVFECNQHFLISRRWSAIDLHGNLQSAVQHIVVQDTAPPLIECPSNQTLSCFADLPPIAYNRQDFESQGGVCSDKCGGQVQINFVSESVSGSVEQNTYSVVRHYRATDECGNSVMAEQQLDVVDEIAPTISMRERQQWWSTMEIDSSFDATAVDNCLDSCSSHWTIHNASSDSTRSGCGSLSGLFFEAGINTIQWSAEDAHGNSASAQQTVYVLHSGNGTLSLNSELYFDADSTTCAYQFEGSEADPVVDDNCPSYTLRNSLNNSSTLAGSILPTGDYTVLWFLDDPCHSSGIDSCVIHVRDITAPKARTNYITLYLDSNGSATLDPIACDAGSTDACGITQRSLRRTHFDCADLGLQHDTLRIADAAGNSVDAVFELNVLDTVAPCIISHGATVYLDANGRADIDVSMVDGGIHDNCSVVSASLNKTHFDCSDLGIQNVELRVLDPSGNESSAVVAITVADTVVPRLSIPASLTVYCSEQSCDAMLHLQCAVEDNCPSNLSRSVQFINEPNVSVNWSQDTMQCALSRGHHHCLFHAWDAAGNSCSAMFTISVRDTTPPLVITKTATISLNASGVATLHVSNVRAQCVDNCSSSSRCTFSLSKSSFHCEDIGYQTVYLSARDESGNITRVPVQIKVVDTRAPVVHLKSIAKSLSGGQVTISPDMVDNGTHDNCGIASRSLSKTQFDCNDVGQRTVVFTATDLSGNTSTAQVHVTIGPELHSSITYSSEQSVTTRRPSTELFLGYGPQQLTLHAHAAGGNGFSYAWSPSTALNCTNCANPIFHPQQSGQYHYTLTVTNAQGCTSQSEISFCVRDPRVTGQSGKFHIRHGSQHLLLTCAAAQQHLGDHSNDRLCYSDDDACENAKRAAEDEYSTEGASTNDDAGNASNDDLNGDTSRTTSEADFDLSVQPDPFSDECQIHCRSTGSALITLHVYTAGGVEVQAPMSVVPGQQVRCGNLWPAGVYLIVATQDEKRCVRRVVKVH